MAAADIKVTALAGEPLDALVWRTLGLGPGAVERVLEANPGLADLGLFLPEGTEVFLPAAARSAPEAEMIQLWN